MKLRGTYGEHLIINDYGFRGSFSIPVYNKQISKHIKSFIESMDDLKVLNKLIVNDTYYNENILSVLHEDPEELEFGGYNPLCDTAIYYFIEDYFEYETMINENDLYAVSKESQELVPIDFLDEDDDNDDGEDYDVTDKDGLDFWLHCATLNIKLKPLDCLPED